MADSANAAFGSYLKTLRERRGLSLMQVCKLSEASPKTIDKGTLSRFERGQQRLALSTLIPLSRIYDVPAGVLVQRLELDTELELVGGPETDGRDRAELHRLGKHALMRRNMKWDAYGFFRDALHRTDPEDSAHAGDLERQTGVVHLNLATVARSLGKIRFALHELEALESAGGVEPRLNAVVLDRIANCYRCLNDFGKADRYADAAIEEAKFYGQKRILAFAYVSRAANALERGDLEPGVDDLHRAFRANREGDDRTDALSGNPSFEAAMLLKLSEFYFRLEQYERSTRAALAGKKISARAGLPAGQAYAELALGELDERGGELDRALHRWRRTADAARRLNNRRLDFSAEFYIFRQAMSRGNRALAAVSRRRLERLAPWVPAHLPLIAEFKELAATERMGVRTVS